MSLTFGTTDALTNTQYAPLAALMRWYDEQAVLQPLQKVSNGPVKRGLTLANKLEQLFYSILAGCAYIVEVNTKLRQERQLAQVKRIDQFAEQSTLSKALNELSQMNLHQLEQAVNQVSAQSSPTRRHDWRGFLRLDFDLSGLPSGKQAEQAEKGYFAGKKTAWVAN